MAADILNSSEHGRIAEAIRDAETSTSGEIYCVVARRSDGYFFSAALVVTYAQRRSHDLTRFAEPEVMITGAVRAPYVPLTNERIDRRHVQLRAGDARQEQ